MSGDTSPEFLVHQEEDAVAARPILVAAALALLIGAIGVVAAAGILARVTGTLHPSAAGQGGPRPAAGTLSHIEQTPVRDARLGIDLRNAQRRELEGWGWVDRRTGVATIPIDRAIDVVVGQEGQDAR